MQTAVYTRETEYQGLRSFVKLCGEESGTGAMLGAALAEELTERQAQMVRMYYIEQHTMRDIAALLGVNVSTVSRTLKSAREKLKKCLRYTNRAFLRADGV